MNLRDTQKSEAILSSILDDRRAAPFLPARRAADRGLPTHQQLTGATRQYPCATRKRQTPAQNLDI
ncbi:hypothetical protein A2U01_0053644 [Trifolium medium]|uniref:Uncharacterized protein n=1 Tax=Trifolium medium TaxID=97028 RepID=A0A392R9I7_9FABA|nr:hypothetical protein [Trifolium medium]